MGIPYTDELIRAYFARAGGYFPAADMDLIAAPDPVYLMLGSVPGLAVNAIGRAVHAVQVSGLATGQGVKIQASMDQVVWTDVGAEIVANGIVQLTAGAYGWLKAILSTAGGSTLNGALSGGETTVVVVSGANFPTAGEGLIAGVDRFSYTGKATNNLTGVPATGDLAVGAQTNGAVVIQANIKIALVSFR